jgi:hypothetical protein
MTKWGMTKWVSKSLACKVGVPLWTPYTLARLAPEGMETLLQMVGRSGPSKSCVARPSTWSSVHAKVY